jgi:hypothetical protein
MATLVFDRSLETPYIGANVVPGHMEACWVYGWDAQRRVGWYEYLAATDDTGTTRRESVYLFLPDGTVLTRRGIGTRSRVGIAAGDLVEMACDEPFARWHTGLHGDLDVLPPDAWTSGVTSGTTRVDLDLALTSALTPPWSTEGPDGDPPPAFRYHQLHATAATLRLDGDAQALAGTSFRSHSVRRREVPDFTGHVIGNVRLPSGRAAGVLAYRAADGAVGRSRGFYYDGKALHDAEVQDFTFLTGARRDDRVHLALGTDVGDVSLTAKTVAGVFTTVVPGERGAAHGGYDRLGVHDDDGRGLLFSFAFAEWELDGERAVGPCERSVALQAVR